MDVPTSALEPMIESVRLAKHLASMVPCSRSEAEQYIAGGWVTVDGAIAEEPGLRISPQQHIELLPDATLGAIVPVTLLLHKPAEIAPDLTALLPLFQPETRVVDDHVHIRFLKRHLTLLTLVAPLEAGAAGLLVATQDWRVARKLVDELARVEQEYVAEVAGELSPDKLELLNHGLQWNGKPLAPSKVSWQNETHLRFAIKGPQPGQIAGMCEKVGIRLLDLKRIRIGRVSMAALPSGHWRYLPGYQRF